MFSRSSSFKIISSKIWPGNLKRSSTEPAPSTRDPQSSLSPDVGGQQTEHVLRRKYNDPGKLREGLNAIFGEGQYKISVRVSIQERLEDV